MDIWSTGILLVVGATFLGAGMVKGLVGIGFPTIGIGVLTAVVGIKTAAAMVLLPAILTNVWQALSGPNLAPALRRTWLVVAASCATVWFGVGVLAAADAQLLSGILGGLLMGQAAYSLARLHIPPPGRWDAAAAIGLGGLNGFITGLTGTLGMPGMLYLQALNLDRDSFVQAMGILFGSSAAAFAVALWINGLLTLDLGTVSALGLVPALAGMAAGQALRRRIPEETFRAVFFVALFLLGAWLAWKAFGQASLA